MKTPRAVKLALAVAALALSLNANAVTVDINGIFAGGSFVLQATGPDTINALGSWSLTTATGSLTVGATVYTFVGLVNNPVAPFDACCIAGYSYNNNFPGVVLPVDNAGLLIDLGFGNVLNLFNQGVTGFDFALLSNVSELAPADVARDITQWTATAAIPEPSTYALFGLGLLAIGAFGSKRYRPVHLEPAHA